jgi:hypothetical protein
MKPTPIDCPSAGKAIEILLKARAAGLGATYHPTGGDTAAFDLPIRHTVWVVGEQPADVTNFIEQIGAQRVP